MRPIEIPLDQGVELGGAPDRLTPGALQIGRNVFYEPESSTLRRLWGRSLFGTIAAARITGLDFASFRNGNKFLIGTAGTTLATAPVGPTGVFTSRKTLAAAAGQAESRYMDATDRVYWFDGVNTPQVWAGSGNTRDMGLQAPTTAPTVTVLDNTGSAYPAGTTYGYCFTEYDDVNGVESAASPVATMASTINTQTFKLELPAKLSSATTKFRIYRSQSGGAVFFRLAEVDATTVRYYDGTDDEALSDAVENTDIYGFATVDDLYLATQPIVPMLGSPLEGNYITVNGTVPNGDIICVFEDSLIVAGVPGYPQDVYYSQEFRPESFSPVYFYREGNALGDKVTGLGVANDRLIAFTLNSIWRHDRLARVTDPGFGARLATRREVALDHGCIAKRSVCGFSVGNPNDRLFYLSNRGPRVTDGYVTWPIGNDLDWSERVINFEHLSHAAARNFPKYRVVLLALASPGSSHNDIAFLYHYDPAHQKKSTGAGKWTGPHDLRVAQAAVAFEEDTETRMFIADDDESGQVYLEEGAASDASEYRDADGSIDWEWMTGDLPIGGMARMKKVGRVFMSHETTDDFHPSFTFAMNKADQEHAITLATRTLNEAGTERIGTSTVTRLKTRTSEGGIHETGTHLRLHMQESQATTDRAIVAMEIEVEDFGPKR